ncbi:hypothetical protein O181_042855 [Austropuccinia psidii MF-1]|uniref:Protein transport protein SEC31 n=1 Tax=Austropuccinia psidii MF-1 TaxID=1389203 RepID=A0A9Q3HIK9_9BASI|nr:hypothetical protein [Austropuccinia psidii MF-1]
MRYNPLPRTATFAWSPPVQNSSTPSNPSVTPTNDDRHHLKESCFKLPLLATGTASGVLDSSFSAESKLEIWSPFSTDAINPIGQVTVESRFNRLVWGQANQIRSHGLIAAGMENSQLSIWDPVELINKDSSNIGSEIGLVSEMKNHTGPIKGLDFNPIKNNLLASGANKGEVFIWDLNNPVKPFAPPSSRSLDDVTSVNWNHIVQSVLAASSNNGYTVVWDIREANGQKGREVAALSYSGSINQIPVYGQPQPPMMTGPQYGSQWIGPTSGRPGAVSSVVWHPENPTKLATCSEDDTSPIVLVWDLRNARAPERVLSGHEKGILSLSWCQQDSDLLISCGKDCRTICWNPSKGEIIAELPPSSNWSFQADWCPRNPDLIATASFDGRIAIHSLQSTNEQSNASQPQPITAPAIDGSDIFGDQGILALNSAKAAISCKQAPKWLKRPATASFAFAGKLVMASNLASANQPAQTAPTTESHLSKSLPTVTIKQVVTEPNLVERALKLENASQARNLQTLCEERTNSLPSNTSTLELQSWKLLSTLFKADSRDELVTLLGFSKDEIKSLVENQIESLKASKPSNVLSRTVSEAGPATIAVDNSHSDSGSIPREPLVTFADNPESLSALSEGGGEATVSSVDAAPSEASVSAISEGTKLAEAESEITEPSLFGDDNANAAGQTAASVDFYNSMGNNRPVALPDHVFSRIGAASSVGATVGSRTSSLASEITRTNTFQIYPQGESKADRLITRALVLGDFESAVSLCISTERFADAILLGVKGGPQLLQKAQKAYFENQTINLPYLRLYQSIVLDDLVDVVQNADLAEWQEIFVVLCTFAQKGEFPSLVEQLGQRLEYLSQVLTPNENSEQQQGDAVDECRKNAILCYLAAGKLEKVVAIWVEQMKEEEQAMLQNVDLNDHKSRFSIHAEVLQTFIEKVTVFQSAITYIDLDLAQPTDSPEIAVAGARSYKLSILYDYYCEYAELLASQGLANTALRFIAQTPLDYARSASSLSSETRERLSKSIGLTSIVANHLLPPEQKTPTSTTAVPPLEKTLPQALPGSTAYQSQYIHPIEQSGYTTSSYNPQQGITTSANTMGINYSSPYEPAYGQAPLTNNYAQVPNGSFLPPPPVPIGTSQLTSRAPSASQPPPPPPIAASRQGIRELGGWNDAPAINPSKKNLAGTVKPKAAISSPFPGVARSMSPAQPHSNQFGGYGTPPTAYSSGPSTVPPPPPRGGARTPGQVPPPPKAGVPQTQQYVNPNSYNPPSVSLPPQQSQLSSMGAYAPNTNLPVNQAFTATPPPGPYGPSVIQNQTAGFPPPGNQGNFTGVYPQTGYPAHPVMPHPMQQAAHRVATPPHMYAQQTRGSPLGAQASGPYALPSQAQGPPMNNSIRPGGFSNSSVDPGRNANMSPVPKVEAPKTKYPAGDRSHIPEVSKPIYISLQRLMNQMKQGLPPNQKKLVDDTERRLNVLFDGLNCETVPSSIIEELLEIVKAIEARNLQLALQLHVSLLTSGIKSDELTTYMPAIKMLITKLQ